MFMPSRPPKCFKPHNQDRRIKANNGDFSFRSKDRTPRNFPPHIRPSCASPLSFPRANQERKKCKCTRYSKKQTGRIKKGSLDRKDDSHRPVAGSHCTRYRRTPPTPWVNSMSVPISPAFTLESRTPLPFRSYLRRNGVAAEEGGGQWGKACS